MTRKQTIRTLIAQIERYLAGFEGPGIADVLAGIAQWKDGAIRDVTPARIAPTRHMDVALEWMKEHGHKPLAAAIEAVFPISNGRLTTPILAS